MTEGGVGTADATGLAGPDERSAGALLRAARERRGLHIAALAASIKVSPRKLEALEADRYADLLDMTFARALAQTVCRALKIDAQPVLDKLPQAGDLPKLAQVGGGLNAPFRGSPASRNPSEFVFHRRPAFWATLVVLLAALAMAMLPERWMMWHGTEPWSSWLPTYLIQTTPAVPAAAAAKSPTIAVASVVVAPQAWPQASAAAPSPQAMGAASAVIETVHSAPLAVQTGSAAAGVLTVRANAESWVEVQDARGQMLLSRNVQPGEAVGLDGALPLRVTIGNAAVTQLVFRGQPIDLATSTRDNVAKLQLP